MNINGLLPSKKILWLLGALVVVGVIFVFLYNRQTSTDSPPEIVKTELQKTRESINETDTDGDGLKDWEELLWGSDSTLIDTDGDGTNDKEEIDSGRNPTIAGPDDLLSDTFVAKGSSKDLINSPDESLTQTGEFARTILSRYLTLKQGGVELDSESINDFVGTLLNDIGPIKNEQFTQIDLSLIGEPSESEIRLYGNTTGTLLTIVFQNMIDISNKLQKPVSDFTNEDIFLLNGIVSDANISVSKLAKTPTPSVIADVHLALANNLSSILTSISQIAGTQTDPVAAISALTNYQESIAQTGAILEILANYFNGNAISFSPSEPGYVIVNR
jgi:hypothetical protein